MKHINLEEFASGALNELINREMKRVTENIQDPNTSPKAKRKITVEIIFKPNEQRDFVSTEVNVKPTLAPALGALTVMAMGRDPKTGEVDAVEIGNQIPGQMSFQDMEVDPSTGEIHETNNVIDMRKARQA